MRRPPIACRRAVQSLQPPTPQHIWIPDELLSRAVNQFFRTPCPHQKRHGSHVPGPLEARRRAAKRRMTVSANFYPQDNFPSPFSLGALFGFRKDSQPIWRYEPPSLPKDTEPLNLPVEASSLPPSHRDSIPPVDATVSISSPYLFGARKSTPQNVEQQDAVEDSITRLRTGALPGPVAAGQTTVHKTDRASDVVESAACFEDFKSRVVHAGDLPEADRNWLLVKAFRSTRPSHSDGWVYNLMVIKHLAELNWDPTPLFSKTWYFAVPPIYTTESMELLSCLEKLSPCFPHRRQHFLRLYMKLAETVASAQMSTSFSQDTELLYLIRQLWQLAYLQSTSVEQSVMAALSAIASKIGHRHYRSPLQAILADITESEHRIMLLVVRASENPDLFLAAEQTLTCFPPESLRRLVPSITGDLVKAAEGKTRFPQSTYKHRLNVWLMLLHSLDAKSASDSADAALLDAVIACVSNHIITIHTYANRTSVPSRPDVLLNALVFKLSKQDPLYALSYERLLQLIDSVATSMLESESSARPEEMLGTIFSRMQQESLPYEELATIVTTLLTQHADFDYVLRFLTVMEQRRLRIHDNPVREKIIARKIARLWRPTASVTERQHKAFALRASQLILEVLGRITASSNEASLIARKQDLTALQGQYQFGHIINRAQASNTLPLVYRSLTSDSPVETRIGLIHQLAHQYCLDGTRSSRETSRAIYYLYRHLQQHSLPIGPLFTKAVVRSFIIRPLAENRFVSARRLIWVCQLVARVEGENVAKKVETIFWNWRGDVIKHAKSVYVSVGGDPTHKAHIGTMKRLGLS